MVKTIRFLVQYVKHRFSGATSPVEYYSRIGDDIVPSMSTGFKDTNRPLWLNLGYWEVSRTYYEACEAMARKVADFGEFSTADSILDVGFGFGEQDFLWMREYSPVSITGINITPIQVEVANERLKNASVNKNIQFMQGNAVDMQFDDNVFSKVVALESAFNFSPRLKFFEESYRVLKNNGVLIIADMCSLPKEKWNGYLQKKGRKEIFIPDENAITAVEYAEQLRQIGFVDIEVESISNYVYTGARKYFLGRIFGKDISHLITLSTKDYATGKGPQFWGKAYGMSDFVLIRAKKI